MNTTSDQQIPASLTAAITPPASPAPVPEPAIEEVPANMKVASPATVAPAVSPQAHQADPEPKPFVMPTAPPAAPNLELLKSLEQYNVPEVMQIANKLENAQLPADLKLKAENQLSRIGLTLKYGGSIAQLDITAKYVDWITSLPWYARTEDILDINKVKASLDSSHYGLDVLKKKILEFLSIIALQKKMFDQMHYHVQSPMFVGLAGTGKTTFAKAIAEALGRKFIRIPFGGLSSARDLRGQSKTSPESEPGLVMRALRDAQCKNPVILLDELDRVSPDARAEVMGVLLELLDPGQNSHFTDNFIDYPFDLSEVLFVATGNNTTNVASAVLDRLEVVQMPSYNDEEKMAIGKNYILPQMIKQVGLRPDQLTIDEALWPKMVRPLGFEPGIRSLERMVQNIVRRVAFKIVSGEGESYHIDEGNVQDYTNIIVGAQ
jgi:ATP-dependent Lon protease